MNTETTETFRGWVFYDADCLLCRAWAARLHGLLLRHRWHLAPLQARWVVATLDNHLKDDLNDNAATSTATLKIHRGDGNFSLSAACGGEGRGEVAQFPTPPLTEMKLLTADGRIYGGADAILHVARSIWWAWPFFLLGQFPGLKPILRAAYRRLARNRHCLGEHCRVSVAPTKPHRHLTSSFYEMP